MKSDLCECECGVVNGCTAPKTATVTRWGRALNQPRKGKKVVIMARMIAPKDQPWGVKQGDPWALVAWTHTQTGCVPAETYVKSCWIPAEWLEEAP